MSYYNERPNSIDSQKLNFKCQSSNVKSMSKLKTQNKRINAGFDIQSFGFDLSFGFCHLSFLSDKIGNYFLKRCNLAFFYFNQGQNYLSKISPHFLQNLTLLPSSSNFLPTLVSSAHFPQTSIRLDI